ncbi:MAG TPA: glycosyltransferase [Bacteroidales bacterium]|nr:glycosyltransferase [Bacteroidales bacterium]
MNILILTHSYPDSNNPWRGVFVQEQAKALSLKHDVTVVFFKTDYSRFAPFSGVKFTKKETGSLHEYEVVTARSFPVINQVKYLRDTFLFVRRELTAVKKIDLIHSHLSYPAGFLGTIMQKLLKIPNITTEHSWIKKTFSQRSS